MKGGDCSMVYLKSFIDLHWGAMDRAGAIEVFKRSVPFFNLKYTGYLGDGDK